MTTTDIALIAAGLAAGAAIIVAVLIAVIRRNGGEQQPHQGADEEYAAELHDMAAYAAEAPPEFAPPERRRLTDDWPEQLSPPHMPELGEPALVRPYVYGRHHEDTVEIVPADYRLPTGHRVPLTTDTQQMTAVQA
jgi:hypothetical protein